MNISKNTQDITAIVISKDATARERFAADELKKYIQIICGAELCISNEAREQSIYIGSASELLISKEELSAVCPGPEGIYIKSFGENSLIVTGSDDSFERGCVYAVYELLERYMGASLSAFTNPDVPGGEILPEISDISLVDLCYIKRSGDLPNRGAIVQYADERGRATRGLNIPFFDWLCKNRYNNIVTWATCYEQLKEQGLLEEADRRGLTFTVGHHEASKLFLPPHGNEYFSEHYYETHPEYYRLSEDGVRYEDINSWGQWVFCSRSAGLIDTLARNIKTWLSKNPLVGTVFFPPNDGIAEQCTCDACKPYSKVENYYYTINEVAKKVREEYPEVKILGCAYTDLFDCPENMELDPAVCVMEATWHESGLRAVGKPDGSCLVGTFFEDNLAKWHALGANAIYYDYYMGVYPARQRYLPMADEVQAICKSMKAHGFLGSSTQIECFNHWNHIFNFYCFARTAYDMELDMEENLARFVRIFGEGADDIAQVIRYAESVMDGQADIMSAGRWLMENIDKEKVYDLYDAALSKAKAPAARNNIRLMRMAFRYSDLETSLPESPKGDANYKSVYEYTEPTGELNAMGKFDSFWRNDPGYGIDIPGKAKEQAEFSSIWYNFD